MDRKSLERNYQRVINFVYDNKLKDALDGLKELVICIPSPLLATSGISIGNLPLKFPFPNIALTPAFCKLF